MSGSGNNHPQGRLSEYLDDELGIEERAAIDRHLASCEDCRGSLDALRRLSRAIAEESVPPLPADLSEKIGRRLDEATLLRPSRWRFAVPATIAATISVIGILVALQWREGRLTPPSVREEARPTDAAAPVPPPPAPPVTPMRDESVALKSKERSDADAGGADEKLEAEIQHVEAPKDSGTQVGGVASVREADAEEGTGGAHENRARAAVATQSMLLQKKAEAVMASPPAAKADALTTCADRWSDSGVRGTWEVADPATAAQELDRTVLDVGGTGLWRGIDDGRPYLLIVPRSRYLEVFYALRARGIAGLVEPPALAEGDDCTAISITIVHAR